MAPQDELPEGGAGLAGALDAEPDAPAEPTTVALAVAPDELSAEEQEAIAAVAADVDAVVAAAEAIQVRTGEEAQSATEFLSRIAGERKAGETARTKLVKPLNDHVRMINDTFRPKTAALEAADRIVRQRVLGYQAELERKAREEQERIDAERRERERAAEEERRRVEAEAQAERERAAREAAAAEAEARRQMHAAEEAAAKVREEVALEMRTLPRSMVEHAAAHGDGDRREAAKADLERRDAEERAQAARAAAEEAARREEEARAAEQAAHDAPAEEVPDVQVVAESTVRAPSGSAGTTKRWTHEVTDAAKVPVSFTVPELVRATAELPESVELRPVDDKAIRKLVRAGVRSIPGVRIYQETGLSVRAR